LKNLCIIPARGGSKRIPRKNIRPFLGKPIIVYSIETALESMLFDVVMVSTDDTEIAELVKDFGAEVPFMRSTKNADDFATTVDVIKEVVSEYEKIGQKFTNICCIYPTAPFVTVERLKEGYKLIDRFDSVVPVTEFSFPVWRAFRLDKESNLKYQWPEFEKSRSQDLEKLYHDAGQWYWIKNSILNNSLITSKTGSIMLSNLETQDIDNETDWRIAEMKAKILNLKR